MNANPATNQPRISANEREFGHEPTANQRE